MIFFVRMHIFCQILTIISVKYLQYNFQIVGVKRILQETIVPKIAGNWQMRLSASVSFVDLSSKPAELFAKPPSINVEIPANLLYPFRKST